MNAKIVNGEKGFVQRSWKEMRDTIYTAGRIMEFGFCRKSLSNLNFNEIPYLYIQIIKYLHRKEIVLYYLQNDIDIDVDDINGMILT